MKGGWWKRVVGHTYDTPPVREVSEFGLDNGLLQLRVLDYGATIVDVVVHDVNGPTSVLMKLPDLASYTQRSKQAYVGSTMGRFARIVAGGQLVIDGRPYQLSQNEGPNHIHGGVKGFDAQMWAGRHTETEFGKGVLLELQSGDGDQGYPGTFECQATFVLDGCSVRVCYEAVCDKPTLCGLTAHAFWNLSGANTIDDHVLELGASAVVEADDAFVPSGRLRSLADGLPDFRTGQPLRRLVIDHCLRASNPDWYARLVDPGSGRSLTVRTDQPAIAVYTGDNLEQPRNGICFQPGPMPDTPNQPVFPDAILRPGEVYRSESTYELAWKGMISR